MATLHVLANPAEAGSCVAALAPGDCVLLVGDGTFALRSLVGGELPGAVRLGALTQDAEQRAVTLEGTRALSYADFVAWAVACDRSVTWT